MSGIQFILFQVNNLQVLQIGKENRIPFLNSAGRAHDTYRADLFIQANYSPALERSDPLDSVKSEFVVELTGS